MDSSGPNRRPPRNFSKFFSFGNQPLVEFCMNHWVALPSADGGAMGVEVKKPRPTKTWKVSGNSVHAIWPRIKFRPFSNVPNGLVPLERQICPLRIRFATQTDPHELVSCGESDRIQFVRLPMTDPRNNLAGRSSPISLTKRDEPAGVGNWILAGG